MSVLAAVVAIVGALLGAGGLAAILQTRSANRKIDAEATKLGINGTSTLAASITASYVALVAQLNSRIDRLVTETDRLVAENAACLVRIDELSARLGKVENGDRVAIERLVLDALDQEIAKRSAP